MHFIFVLIDVPTDDIFGQFSQPGSEIFCVEEFRKHDQNFTANVSLNREKWRIETLRLFFQSVLESFRKT